MVYLLLAIASSALISIIMRISAGKAAGGLGMLAVNYLVCSLLGAAYADFSLFAPEIPGFSTAVWLGVPGGIALLGGFVLLQVNTRKNGIVLSSLFMKLGLLVPMVISVVFFREIPTLTQIAGFILAVGAIVLINWHKGARSAATLGLIGLLLLGGSSDAMAKVFQVLGVPAHENRFLFYSFFTALLLCCALVIGKKERITPGSVLFGALIGIPNFFSSKFLLGALTQLPAVVVYPTFSVATILIVTACGMLFFKECLCKRQWVAMGGIIAALILLNI